MDTETRTAIDLDHRSSLFTRHIGKLLYLVVFIAGAAVSQFARNIELTMAVGLVVRVVFELSGAAIVLTLIAIGAWTVMRLITGENT